MTGTGTPKASAEASAEPAMHGRVKRAPIIRFWNGIRGNRRRANGAQIGGYLKSSLSTPRLTRTSAA
jgi:hypothetical protein